MSIALNEVVSIFVITIVDSVVDSVVLLMLMLRLLMLFLFVLFVITFVVKNDGLLFIVVVFTVVLEDPRP